MSTVQKDREVLDEVRDVMRLHHYSIHNLLPFPVQSVKPIMSSGYSIGQPPQIQDIRHYHRIWTVL